MLSASALTNWRTIFSGSTESTTESLWDDTEARWKMHLKPFFGAMRAVDLSSGLIAGYVDVRQQGGAANATINRELAALKRMFGSPNKPLHRKYNHPSFPRLTENNARTGFLADSQRDALAAQCASVGLWSANWLGGVGSYLRMAGKRSQGAAGPSG